MAGLLDLFNPSAPAQTQTNALPYAGILGAAGALGQAAMPSRMPISLGAALGMAGPAFLGGMQQGQQSAMGAQALDQARMANMYQHAVLPMQIQLADQLGGQPGPQSGDPNAPLLTPQEALAHARLAALNPKDSRGAAPWLSAYNAMLPGGGGYQMTPNGVAPTPGAIPSRAGTAGAVVSAEEFAKLPPQTQAELMKAGIRVQEAGATPRIVKPGETALPQGINGMTQGTPGNAAYPFDPNDPQNDIALRAISDPGMRAAVFAGARANNVSVPIAVSTALTESGGNPNAPVGSAGEIGPFQVKPTTAAQFGIVGPALADPTLNAFAGAKYLRQMIDQNGGNLQGGVGHYNAGPNGAVNPDYVNRWNSHYSRFQAPAQVGAPAPPAAAPAPASQGAVTVPGANQAALETSQGAATGKELAAIPARVNEFARQGQLATNQIDAVTSAIQQSTKQGLPTGFFSPAVAEVAAAAKNLGIDTSKLGVDPKAVGNIQQAEESLVQISGAILKNIFPQRITNQDIKLYMDSLPGIQQDPAALEKILSWARSQAQYNVAMGKHMNQTLSANGGQLPPTWEPQFLRDNGYGPIFNPLTRNLDGPVSTPAPTAPKYTEGQTATGPGGAKLTFTGGVWVKK